MRGYNEYIGARYVPVFDGDWDNTNEYEPLVIVSYQGNSYTSKTFVPTGVDINNDVYWALTGNYNAQVEAYRREVLATQEDLNLIKTYAVTPQEYGAKGDGIADDLLAFRNMLADIKTNGGGICYIPAGTYLISGDIVIPENTSFVGSGFDSFIYLTISGNNSGNAIVVAGDNVVVENIRVGFNGDNQAGTLGTQMCGMSVANWKYDVAVTDAYDIERKELDTEDRSNVLFKNIFHTGRFAVGCENITDTHSIKNVIFENIYAPNGLVSSAGHDGGISVIWKNVVCAFTTCGYGYNNNDIIVDGVVCDCFHCSADINASNIIVNANKSDSNFNGVAGRGAFFIGKGGNFSNITINNKAGVTVRSYAIDVADGVSYVNLSDITLNNWSYKDIYADNAYLYINGLVSTSAYNDRMVKGSGVVSYSNIWSNSFRSLNTANGIRITGGSGLEIPSTFPKQYIKSGDIVKIDVTFTCQGSVTLTNGYVVGNIPQVPNRPTVDQMLYGFVYPTADFKNPQGVAFKVEAETGDIKLVLDTNYQAFTEGEIAKIRISDVYSLSATGTSF